MDDLTKDTIIEMIGAKAGIAGITLPEDQEWWNATIERVYGKNRERIDREVARRRRDIEELIELDLDEEAP